MSRGRGVHDITPGIALQYTLSPLAESGASLSGSQDDHPSKYVRGWFARVGSDPYYASYDRSLGNIKTELDRLQAARQLRAKAWAAVRARFWRGFAGAYAVILALAAYVNRQPPGTYTHSQQATRVAPAFLAPVAAWLAHRLLGWLQAVLDRRSASRVCQLELKLRKQVSELKDSTRYERTLALLQKYDPDYVPPKPQRTPSARGALAGGANGRQLGAAAAVPPSGLPARAAGAAVNVAGSALQGAGARMFPVLAQLYSQAAGTLIADDPVMLGLLREAQQQSDILRQRLLDAEARAVALLQANIALKQQMGLPTDEEQAALAAWMGSGANGGGGRATAVGVALQGAAPAVEPGTGLTEGAAGEEELVQQQGEGRAGGQLWGREAAAVAAPAAPAEQRQSWDEPGSDGSPSRATPEAAAAGGGSASHVSRRKRGGRS